MRKHIWVFVAAVTLCVSDASATKLGGRMMSGCGLTEQVNIGVNFNFRAESFAAAKTKFDEKMKQVEEFAKQQKIEKFNMQSMNYNISSQPNYEGGGMERSYQLNGGANYQVDSSDAAFKMAEFLTQQKFQVNVNANSYRSGNCNNMMME